MEVRSQPESGLLSQSVSPFLKRGAQSLISRDVTETRGENTGEVPGT